MVSMLLASALTNAGIHHRSLATPPPSLRSVNVSLSFSTRAVDSYVVVIQTLPTIGNRVSTTAPQARSRSMLAAELMGSVYWKLLIKLENQQFDVFGPKPTRLNKGQKLLLILRTWWRFASGTMSANYGT